MHLRGNGCETKAHMVMSHYECLQLPAIPTKSVDGNHTSLSIIKNNLGFLFTNRGWVAS